MLSGRVRFHAAGNEVEAGPGATVLIPAGTAHTFKGLGPGPSRVLVELSPGAGVGMFREIESEGLRPDTDGARIAEVAARYGVDFIGPPLG